MECTIDILPREVLHIVFTNLSLPDRLNASRVCKKWLETLNCKPFLKDIVVYITDNRTVPVFSSMSRNFLNFSFKFIIVDVKYYELFKRFSSYIECLSFEKCEVWKREPVNFDDLRYDNLKVLRIIDCELWTLFPCLPNLSELYLTGNSTITDDGVAILQKTMKHLKVLSLLCTISYEQKIIKRFYPQEVTYETNPSSLILSFPAIHSFISERASTLKEIYLCPLITPSALKDISSIKDLRLKKIDLTDCFYCADGLIDMFKNQPTLKTINLNGASNISDEIVEALCSLLPDVEEISLHASSITDKSFRELFRLTKLSELDIGGGANISAHTFNEAVSNFKSIHIKSLNLSFKLYDARDMALSVLLKQCKNLVYLDLSFNNIRDKVLHIISENLVNLEYLCLIRSEITDYGLTGCKTEHVLHEDTDENVHASISNLKNLKELKLNDCHEITDNAVIDTIKFPYLEFLYVSGCKLKLDTVQILLMQNPNIRKIYWDEYNLEHPKIGPKRNSQFNDFMEEQFVRVNDLECDYVPDDVMDIF